MEFVKPSFLFGLFAIAIPIIIHLFNLRKFKKIAFTNVQFLKEVKEETQSKSKLKHLLILCSRILAISFLVFAFAQPFIPSDKENDSFANNAVSIFIDNSFSMDALGENGALLAVAKQLSIDIVSNYKNTDQIQVLSNNFDGKSQHFINKDQATNLTQEIESSPITRNIQDVIKRQEDVIVELKNSNKTIFYLSDFQKTTNDVSKVKLDSTVDLRLVPLESNTQNNLYIDSVWFDYPIHQLNQEEKINIRIVNTSEENYENVPLKLIINDQQKALNSFSIEGNSTVDSTLSFSNTSQGIQKAKIEIVDYPITYDDVFYFNYSVIESIPILCLFEEEKNPHLNSLLTNESLFQVTFNNINQLDYSLFNTHKVVILSHLKTISSGLSQEVEKFIKKGGTLIVLPHKQLDKESYHNFSLNLGIDHLNTLDTSRVKVSYINTEDELYQNVFEKIPKNIDLPLVSEHFTISSQIKNASTSIMKMENDHPFLNKYNKEGGTVYLFTSPLSASSSNLGNHAIFVPTFYKMILLSSNSEKLYHKIGRDNVIEIEQLYKTEHASHIVSANGQFDFIPETRRIGTKTQLFVHNRITHSGNYDVQLNNEIIGSISFNYSGSESNTATYSFDEIKEQVAQMNQSNINVMNLLDRSVGASITEMNEGKRFWKVCILLTLLFLGIEVLLIKFWNR